MDVLYQRLQNNACANKVLMESCCRGFGILAVVSLPHLNDSTVRPPGGSGEVSTPANKCRAVIYDSPYGLSENSKLF